MYQWQILLHYEIILYYEIISVTGQFSFSFLKEV